jgi:hypothetical protein
LPAAWGALAESSSSATTAPGCCGDKARRFTGVARVQGQFAAFTDPAASDLSVLGRDVLDHFDLIVSKRRNDVLILAGIIGISCSPRDTKAALAHITLHDRQPCDARNSRTSHT